MWQTEQPWKLPWKCDWCFFVQINYEFEVSFPLCMKHNSNSHFAKVKINSLHQNTKSFFFGKARQIQNTSKNYFPISDVNLKYDLEFSKSVNWVFWLIEYFYKAFKSFKIYKIIILRKVGNHWNFPKMLFSY